MHPLAPSHLISTPDDLKLPRPVSAVVFDFDGVFTDNKVWVDQDGREMAMCDRSDGLGVQRLLRAGIPTAVVSKERVGIVQHRCRKLGVPCWSGIDDKPPVVLSFLHDAAADPAHAVYVGNDLIDIGAFGVVGCGLAPPDSHPAAIASANAVLRRPGGHGAVREVCDAVLATLPASDPPEAQASNRAQA